ncbi:Cytochrome P450 [Macrophomina phaseolina MS6]|uniref:Cytochrome P450 n=1 Tax=Macrophomina phaseolina (strain MS6) TaxID=1126212 RepID=K2RE13_MACPH|nr:Cytochrome P450 [Macrophomina phaseolina MS6]
METRKRTMSTNDMNGTFVSVQPDRWYVNICDDLAVVELLKNKDVWLKPGMIYNVLSAFGPNVVSVNGKAWARHRKVTAPCFNERLSAVVWEESIRQARSMVSYWGSASPSSGVSHIENICEDTRALALNVLCYAGFGVQQDFATGMHSAASAPEGHEMSHRDALWIVMTNMFVVFLAAMMPSWVLRWCGNVWCVPKSMRKVVRAMVELEQHMREIMKEVRTNLRTEGREKSNLIATLLRSSEGNLKNGAAALTDEEILGNLFIFNIAGHDTTANTLSFALAALAVNLHVQDWVREELENVLQEDEKGVKKYEQTFPRLLRCQAVMNETLRRYGPVVTFLRESIVDTTIPLSTGATLDVPAGTKAELDLYAAHNSSAWATLEYPATIFAPQRWIQVDTETGEESLCQPKGTTFIPWATGPRACLATRFSQVEFVAVLSTVLRTHKLTPALRGKGGDVAIPKDEEERLAREAIHFAIRNAGCEGTTRSIRKKDMPLFALERI